MYASSGSNEYHKFSGPPEAPPPTYGGSGIATGIPVNSSGSDYYSDSSRPPPPAHLPLQILPKTRGPWSTGLCDCTSDVGNLKAIHHQSGKEFEPETIRIDEVREVRSYQAYKHVTISVQVAANADVKLLADKASVGDTAINGVALEIRLMELTNRITNCAGCITFWCPCITFGQIAEIVDKGSSSCGTSGALYALIACVTGCACCLSCFYRTKLRQQFFLHEKPCADCLVHCCCEPCALCQEYRELKNQGFDMSIGWHGNAEKHNRETEMEPVPTEGGMSR